MKYLLRAYHVLNTISNSFNVYSLNAHNGAKNCILKSEAKKGYVTFLRSHI